MKTSLRLRASASLTVIAAVTSLMASAAQAQDVASDLEEVVVTGTSIRGQAPVGAALISVGRDSIESTAAQTVSQILKSVPALSNMGQNSQSNTPPAIHNLGATSSYSTLVLIDGHRMAPVGLHAGLPDPGMLPPNAIERVEVLADGASSIYGSDAVAGVVNFVTRKNFSGTEVSGQAGFGDHYRTQSANLIWGTNFDAGNFWVAGSYSHRDPLARRHRSFTYPDQRPNGGSNYLNFACNPVTMQPGATGNLFLGVNATSSVANNANNALCSNFETATLLAAEDRYNMMSRFTYQFNDRLTVSIDGVYSDYRSKSDQPRGTINSRAFQTGQQANPFYQNPVGYTGAATFQQVQYNFDELLGPGAYSQTTNRNFYLTGNLEYKLGETWRVTGMALNAKSFSRTATFGTVCSSCAHLYLNGTTNSSGNLLQPSVPNTTTFITQLPLTTANALDVWNTGAANRTSADVRRKLTDSATDAPWEYGVQQFRLGADGEVFDVPAGPVRVAGGVEYVKYDLLIDQTQPSNTGPSSSNSTYLHIPLQRDVKSAYAESFIPVVSPEMGIPLVRRMNLNASIRWDEYSDVGQTTNPRIGGDWEVFEGFKLRANWASSFVAPLMYSVGDLSRGGLSSFTCYGSSCPAGGINVNSGTITVKTADHPTVIGVPLSTGGTCTVAMATCVLNSNIGTLFNGAAADPKPSKSDSWSVGLDFAPTMVPGFRTSITMFTVNYKNFITGTSMINALNTPSLGLITFYPNGATQADLDARLPPYASLTGSLPPTIHYLVSGRQGNFNNVETTGLDIEAHYSLPTDTAGTFNFGVAATRFLKFQQRLRGGQEFYSILNSTGVNSTFGAVKTQARFNLGWEMGNFSADVFHTYIGSYRNWSATTITPLITRADSAPIGGGDKVKAQNLFDLNLRYTLQDGVFGGSMAGTQLFFNVDNIFDTEPAFYNGANGYDNFTGNPIGRVVTVGVRAKF
jgi:iron complex outermembrane receptor protein